MPEIKIATYNIRNCQGIDGKNDPSRIADLLKEIDADIIALQEVDKYRLRSNMVNQACKLSKLLRMNYVYGPVNRYFLASAGNALLSKYPITAHINHVLPYTRDPRCCLQVTLDVDNRPLNVFNVHLGLNYQLRMSNLKKTILPMITSLESPAVLVGDLNASEDDPEVKLISSCLHDTFAENTDPLDTTFPANEPNERLDYIFTNAGCTSKKYYIFPSLASDHLPVIAEIEFN